MRLSRVDTGMRDAVALVPTAVAAVALCDNATAVHSGWTAFYRHEYPRLARAMFAYTGDREVGYELAQEAMTRAWSHWARVAQLENPAAWTCRVATNLANSTWRRMRLSRRVSIYRGTEEVSAEPDVGVRLAVPRAVAELPRRQRTAIVLRYFSDLPVEDVARLMDCRPGTVTAMTVQAIAKLRSSDRGFNLTGAGPTDAYRYSRAVVRRAADIPRDPAVVVLNPDDEVTAETFTAWLDRRQAGEPVDPGISAAETLAEARASGEA